MAAPVAAQAIDSKACTEQERSNQTLSEKLGQTDGVICPPDVDSEMKKPAPDAGKTPSSRRREVPAAIRTFGRNDRQITYCRRGG